MSFPLGPYHPALVQPFALTVKLRGETMTGVEEVETGYCVRGVQTLVQGKPLDAALAIVERSCALAGHTHRTVVCQLAESIMGNAPSRGALRVRAAFGEIERMLARLWLLGQTARAVGLDATWRDALNQRELLFAALYQTTGERVFWGVAVPGGIRAVSPSLDLAPLRDALTRIELSLELWRAATSPQGPLGRATAGIGAVSATRAAELGLTGVAARGAGLRADVRRDTPVGAYEDAREAWPATQPTGNSGDAAARLIAAVDDIATSLRLARIFLTAADQAEGDSATAPAANAATQTSDGAWSATVEGPHGPVTARLALTPMGTIDHLRLETPGAALIAALPELLRDRSVGLAPAIIASLDLCVECLDV